MAGNAVVSFGYWAVAGACAVAAGVGCAVWNGPSTVDVPVPPHSETGPHPPPTPAPSTLAAAPAPSA